jgi:hypothetical protein
MLPRQASIAAPAISASLDNTSGRVTWWSFRETSGANPCSFRLWDGSNNAGRLLLPFSLTAGESDRDYSGPFGLVYETGLFLEVLTGAFEGVVQVIDLHEHADTPLPAILVDTLNVNTF